jgi:hypothetical protein
MSIAEFEAYRWTAARYDRAASTGAFDAQRVELIDGRIIR